MFENLHLRSLGIALALGLFGTALSSAGAAEIQDRGAFFSTSAKSEAARIVDDLKRSVKKDVVVDTFKEIPEDLKQGVNLEDKSALNRLVEQWALKQAKSKGVNGVYILLVKTPPHLQVEVGNDTQKKAFTIQDRDGLVRTMLSQLRAKQYDGALLDGVNFVASTMRAHVAGGSHAGLTQAGKARSGNQGLSGWVGPILIGLLVAWVVIAIIRAISRGSGGAGGGSALNAPTTGGGGFFSSLLGGMFGAAAGMWIYDQFSGGHGSTGIGSERENLDSSDSGFSGQDTDYSGSGDSFGDDSGGGDSGGGFGGGDDGGGGDSGGGGDF